MAFKKLHQAIKDGLDRLEITTPTPFQQKSISKIKSGSNFFGIAPEGSGKSTTLIINTLQKLKATAVGQAPRAVIFVEDKAKAISLDEQFKPFTKRTDVRVYMAYDERDIETHKSEIFMGIDILITTPKRFHKLFLVNGVNSTQLQLFILEDADQLLLKSNYVSLLTISESIKKMSVFGFL